MIAFASVVGSDETFTRFALPGLRRIAEPDAPIAQFRDATSMCRAYNQILDAFAEREDLEALVLLHDDMEIRDRRFCTKVRQALADPSVAVLGAVGARGVTSLRWWEGQGVGRMPETRGTIDFGVGWGEVDTVDGSVLVLSPWAVRNLRFDEDRYDAFHGYDVDVCFQARAAGRRVLVEPFEVFHHTKGGYGDEAAFIRGDAAWRDKWMPHHDQRCPVCGTDVSGGVADGQRVIVTCGECGVGVTIPEPSREQKTVATFDEQYGGTRVDRREQWLYEARTRMGWVAEHADAGTLLEVGCATGEFLRVAADRGFAVVGIEPAVWAAGHALALTPEARIHQSLEEWGGLADVAVMFHVLEHVHEPADLLRTIRGRMRPGGQLFIEVPHFGAVDAQADPLGWAGITIEDHVAHHTAATLRRVLEDAGFQVAEERALSTECYDAPQLWASRWERWRGLGRTEPSLDLLRVRALA